MPNKIILTDVDNTLLDYGNVFQQWLCDRGYELPGHVNDVYHVKHLLPLDEEEELNLFADFAHDQAFSSIPPLEGAQEAVRSLVENGWRFVAVTACHTSEAAQRARKRNLEDVFGIEWPDIHYSGVRLPKSAILRAYDPAIWVEDSVHPAREGVDAGHQTFLIDYPYNRLGEGFHRVSGWAEIQSKIET